MIYSPASAKYDALLLTRELQDRADWAYESELHIFAFLGAVSASLEGERRDEWPYQFVSTTQGLPYSGALGDAIRQLRAAGYLVSSQDKLELSLTATDELELSESLDSNRRRAPFLKNAIRLSLFAQVTEVRALVLNIPSFVTLSAMRSNRSLSNTFPDRAPDELNAYDPALKLFAWLKSAQGAR